MVTPFTQEGEVDYAALRLLIDYQLANGADFFCILATTGETPTLTPMERQRIKERLMDEITAIACGLPLHRVVPYLNLPKKDHPMSLPLEDKRP